MTPSKAYEREQYVGNHLSKRGSPFFRRRSKGAAAIFYEKLKPVSALDAGCRTSDVLQLFKALGMKPIAGVDVVPEFVESVTKDGFECKLGDLRKLPFQSKSFEWAFCSHALEHCPDLAGGVKELLRVAKQGAFLVLPLGSAPGASEYHSAETHSRWLEKLPKLERYTLEVVKLREWRTNSGRLVSTDVMLTYVRDKE